LPVDDLPADSYMSCALMLGGQRLEMCVRLSRIQADLNLSQAYHEVFAVKMFPKRLAGTSDGGRRASSFVAGCMRACNGILGHHPVLRYLAIMFHRYQDAWPLLCIIRSVSGHYVA
jgi:hypothetical protein